MERKVSCFRERRGKIRETSCYFNHFSIFRLRSITRLMPATGCLTICSYFVVQMLRNKQLQINQSDNNVLDHLPKVFPFDS